MSALPPAHDSPAFAKHDRPLVVVFWLMLATALWSWSLTWNGPIIDRHEFRQLQTAISAHWIKQDGFRLDYETPLFGPPWSIPLEFPVYQWCVARLSRATGLPLDQSGRATSILFLLATLPAVCGLAGLAGLASPGRLLVAAAVLSSPVYLFYGRTFMIESTALCFSTWFMLATGLAVRDLRLRWSAVAAICGTLAALAKVTTFVLYCFPAAGLALWLGWPHWTARRESLSGVWRAVLLGGVPVLVAAAISEWWVRHADAVKDSNAFSGFLKSSEMTSWIWGTLDQRLSTDVWNTVWSNLSQFVLSEPAFAVLLICAALVAGRLRRLAAAGAAGFILGPLLFANLYFRHDYYYNANALLLLLGAGLLLAGMWNSPALPRAAKVVMVALFFGAQLLAFYRGYGFNHRRELPRPPEIATVIRDTVPPEGVVLIYGWDWNSLVPYYAQRRAVMVPNGREDERDVLEDILHQLPPLRIAALLIRQRVPTPYPPEFIRERLNRFNLAPAPFATSVDGDLYLPEEQIVTAAAKLRDRPLATVTLNTQKPVDPNADKLRDDDLGTLDLPMVSPEPVKARSMFHINVGEVDAHRVIFAHPVSELYFVPPAGAKRIDAEVGIVDAAYAAGGTGITDGVSVEIFELRPNGLRRMLYRRDLNPAKVADDRGPQAIRLDEAGPFTGTVVFRITPGPRNNFENDWAYWGRIAIH